MTITHENRPKWFGYKAGWKDWRALIHCTELVTLASMSHTKIDYSPPPFNKVPIRPGGKFDEVTGSSPFVPKSIVTTHDDSPASLKEKDEYTEDLFADTTMTDSTPGNRRKYRRFPLRLHVEIICQDQIYETYTMDVSLGGVALEGVLPDWVAGYCTVVLSTPDLRRRLEFMCSVVENQLGQNYRLELYPSTHSKELKIWLEMGIPKNPPTAAKAVSFGTQTGVSTVSSISRTVSKAASKVVAKTSVPVNTSTTVPAAPPPETPAEPPIVPISVSTGIPKNVTKNNMGTKVTPKVPLKKAK